MVHAHGLKTKVCFK